MLCQYLLLLQQHLLLCSCVLLPLAGAWLISWHNVNQKVICVSLAYSACDVLPLQRSALVLLLSVSETHKSTALAMSAPQPTTDLYARVAHV